MTGGGGFVGSELGIALLKSNIKIKELVLCDVNEPRPLYGYENDERVVRIKSDLTNPKEADMLFEERTYSAIALLHGLMSGGSEANFDLGMAINLDATRYMLDKIRSIKHAKAPVVLYTSSGAVYGGEVADNTVTDATLPCPQGSYGAQKLVRQAFSSWEGARYTDATLMSRSVSISAMITLDVDGSMHASFACPQL